MFLCTSGVIAQTPVFDQVSENRSIAKIDEIYRSVKSIIRLYVQRMIQAMLILHPILNPTIYPMMHQIMISLGALIRLRIKPKR